MRGSTGPGRGLVLASGLALALLFLVAGGLAGSAPTAVAGDARSAAPMGSASPASGGTPTPSVPRLVPRAAAPGPIFGPLEAGAAGTPPATPTSAPTKPPKQSPRVPFASGGATVDLALNQPIFSASSTAPGSTPANAVDGNTATYWTTAAGGTQSIAVNLGFYAALQTVSITWGPAAATNYELDVSGDGITWIPIYSNIDGNASINASGRSAQFVRVLATAGSNPNEYQLASLQVFGTAGVTPTPAQNLGPCTLTSAAWGTSTASPVAEGTLITLDVSSAGDCIGQQVQLTVYKSNGILPPSNVTDSLAPENLLVDGASTTWRGEYISSGILGLFGDPNYYFQANLVSNPAMSVTSASPMLAISQGPIGTTYYVDPAGSDSNNGTALSTPWQDFTPLANLTLQPGNQVLLKRGGSWNQELVINGQGTAGNFITIGAYGSGARPQICRTGDIADRAMLLNNPSYVSVNSLEVCNAGAGIVVFYNNVYDQQSVYFNDILAHGFDGIYDGTGSASNNPAWQSYVAPDRVGFSYAIGITGNDDHQPNVVITDFRVTNSEIYNTGSGIGLDWDDGASSTGQGGIYTGWYTGVLLDNLYLHDNTYADVSWTSLELKYCQTCMVSNTLIDRGAGGAPLGTSAIFLGGNDGLTFTNLAVRDTPLSWASDNTGIDFESGQQGTTIQDSWFENNAGGAIGFFDNGGINSGVVIADSAFVNNGWEQNYANPGQIADLNWPSTNESSGTIENNWYSNPAGVTFFGGDAASNGGFTLTNNQAGIPWSQSLTPVLK